MNSPTSPPPEPIHVVTLADVKETSVSWIWPGWIPRKKIPILDGDPGLGKSTLLLDIAARVSTGRAMPDGSPGEPGHVLLMSAEDSLEDTIKPRLLAAGADMGAVHHWNSVGEGN